MFNFHLVKYNAYHNLLSYTLTQSPHRQDEYSKAVDDIQILKFEKHMISLNLTLICN